MALRESASTGGSQYVTSIPLAYLSWFGIPYPEANKSLTVAMANFSIEAVTMASWQSACDEERLVFACSAVASNSRVEGNTRTAVHCLNERIRSLGMLTRALLQIVNVDA